MAPAAPSRPTFDVTTRPPAPASRPLARGPGPKTYGCADCARRLGKAPDTFRRNLESYYAAGMPRPLPGPGQRRWRADLFDAWRDGYLDLLTAANDAEAADGGTIDEHRARMRQAYG